MWDNLWRPGAYRDIVVRFDTVPGRVVFWQDTQFLSEPGTTCLDKGDALYVFCPAGQVGDLTIKALGAGSFPDHEIASVALLGSEGKIPWSRTPAGLRVTVPPGAAADFVNTLRIGLRQRRPEARQPT